LLLILSVLVLNHVIFLSLTPTASSGDAGDELTPYLSLKYNNDPMPPSQADDVPTLWQPEPSQGSDKQPEEETA
jgi:hypothetical protein